MDDGLSQKVPGRTIGHGSAVSVSFNPDESVCCWFAANTTPRAFAADRCAGAELTGYYRTSPIERSGDTIK